MRIVYRNNKKCFLISQNKISTQIIIKINNFLKYFDFLKFILYTEKLLYKHNQLEYCIIMKYTIL